MSRIQKILGVLLIIVIASVAYFIYKPTPQKSTIVDGNVVNAPSNKQLKERNNKQTDTTMQEGVTYSKENHDVPGYSNPEEHQ